ncbi:MAG TPA: hypothetical protein VFY04_00855 [Solirubrobacterales bacterium]|nr:hypothetical protein [Solirubrobacterales bacterium]
MATADKTVTVGAGAIDEILPADVLLRPLRAEEPDLAGKYKKLIMMDPGGRKFLFKIYGPGPRILAASAEIAAARVRALLEPETTIEVAMYVWETRLGTIQPMIEATPLSQHQILAHPELAAVVLAEHPIDWLVSNHDGHADHVLARPNGELRFVDKAQAFLYWSKDELAADYHPNRERGQVEPVYNAIYRERSLDLVDLAPLEGRLEQIQALDNDALRRALGPFAEAKFATGAREGFLKEAIARKVQAPERFRRLLARLGRSLDG